jgi:hypothetical protein
VANDGADDAGRVHDWRGVLYRGFVYVYDREEAMTFTSVSREHLQKAFAVAHKLSESPSVPLLQRRQFRVIAQLIWRAHGEPGTPTPEAADVVLKHYETSVDKLTADPHWCFQCDRPKSDCACEEKL